MLASELVIKINDEIKRRGDAEITYNYSTIYNVERDVAINKIIITPHQY